MKIMDIYEPWFIAVIINCAFCLNTLRICASITIKVRFALQKIKNLKFRTCVTKKPESLQTVEYFKE